MMDKIEALRAKVARVNARINSGEVITPVVNNPQEHRSLSYLLEKLEIAAWGGVNKTDEQKWAMVYAEAVKGLKSHNEFVEIVVAKLPSIVEYWAKESVSLDELREKLRAGLPFQSDTVCPITNYEMSYEQLRNEINKQYSICKRKYFN